MNSKTCDDCETQCCRYVAAEIDAPENESDFEEIKWFVSHENVHVYVDEEGDWYVEFSTPCKFFGEDNKCRNYKKRPKICREYKHDECTFHNDYFEKHLFKNLEDVEEYIKKHVRKNKSKG